MHTYPLARMHLQMCINALIMTHMNIENSHNQIEQEAMSLGLSVKELYARAGVAISTRTRWNNGTTDPNTKTLFRLQEIILRHKKKKSSLHKVSANSTNERATQV